MVEGLAYLDTFENIVGHNAIKYDLPVLSKLYGYKRHWTHIKDTLVLSRLVWADIVTYDLAQLKAKKFFPGIYIGKYSLAAWGHRMGNHKGDYEGDPLIADEAVRKAQKWSEWNQAMEDYCVQDLSVTGSLYQRILDKDWAEESMNLEHQVAHIMARQERHGFLFDQPAAIELYGKLVQRRMLIERELKPVFGSWLLRDGKPFTPKRDNKKLNYQEGCSLSKLKLVEFNPGSRDHIAFWLKAMRGWVPTEFTNDGSPKVDEEVISKLPYPEIAGLKEYLMVSKRIGQIAEGKEAWLKRVSPDGRMHGSVNTGGCVTGRMSHSGPNMGQVPATYSPYGPECRSLFTVPEGKKLVGCDAAALELRDLAGYMARYDGGAYAIAVVNGTKEEGTDAHSMNAKALGLDPKGVYFDGESGRDIAKTWVYAWAYGAGDEKLGTTLLRQKGPAAVKRGRQAREDFLSKIPAMGALVKDVKSRAKSQKFLRGLDGRQIPVRHDHAALNTLLQSAGAVQMKRALCILDDTLQAAGLTPGNHYEFVANIHDEYILEVDAEHAEMVGKEAADAIRKAGDYYAFKCPLAGEYKVGFTWKDTH